jgi:ATP/ADP translocase
LQFGVDTTRICPMAQARRIFRLLAALAGATALWSGQAASLLAQTPTATTPATALNYRLILLLIGSLVLLTGILAGVIIYMLKKFKDKY